MSSLRISAKDIKGDSGIDESHKLKEEDEDAESMKKALIKLTEENQQKDFLIEQLEKQKSQLSEVIKKDSFTDSDRLQTRSTKEIRVSRTR